MSATSTFFSYRLFTFSVFLIAEECRKDRIHSQSLNSKVKSVVSVVSVVRGSRTELLRQLTLIIYNLYYNIEEFNDPLKKTLTNVTKELIIYNLPLYSQSVNSFDRQPTGYSKMLQSCRAHSDTHKKKSTKLQSSFKHLTKYLL